MTVRIYNTFTGNKEDFAPVTEGQAKLYVCGVTVYDHSHVGHARSTIVFDVIYRYLTAIGLDVNYVRNFTDVDDKIINRANAEKANWNDIAQKYIASFREDMKSLGNLPPTHEPKATDHIGDMIAFIERLIERGYAYQVDGDVYFSVKKYAGYGALSGRSPEDMFSGARIEIDERKKDPLDFALWKQSKPNEPTWESPFGKGRPGWHIECSTMSVKYLGNPFDMHGGGKDLVFPHHENERAQAECATGRKFVNFWVHNGFVTIEREKMSKSVGNILSIKDFVRRYNPETLRLFFLSSHYRNPVDYTEESIENAETALQKLYYTLERCAEIGKATKALPERNSELEGLETRFFEAMNDDFNTALALSSLFDLSRTVNRMIDEKDARNHRFVLYGRDLLKSTSQLLGIVQQDPEGFQNDEGLRHLGRVGLDREAVETAIGDRVEARKNKEYKKADDIRNMLLEKGITLLDSPGGTQWRIKK